MSNFFKKMIGQISAVSVCLTNSVTTMAEDDYQKYQYDQDAEISMESKEQYINRINLNHLFWYESKDQLGYSNEIPYWNFSTNSIVNNCYFVFDFQIGDSWTCAICSGFLLLFGPILMYTWKP